jgi:cation diffusion facilitator family transporter
MNTERLRYGQLAGGLGIAANFLLCALKLLTGLLSGSIAVVADGINNLTDAASSVITFVGFKLAAAPSDREHPYGHARIEYLTGLFISFMIIILGVKLLTVAVEHILRPAPVAISPALICVIIFSIFVKIFLAIFYFRLGAFIRSDALRAAGADSRNDVIATGQILLGFFLIHLTGLNLDGWLGGIVALFVLFSGIKLVQETSDPLLGKPPDPVLVSALRKLVLSTPEILGLHDLMVHDYGPGRLLASVHAEVDAKSDFVQCHEMIDAIEHEAFERLGVQLVIHPDPIDTRDPATCAVKAKLTELARGLSGVAEIHDLRLIRGAKLTNVVFDIVLTHEAAARQNSIRREMEEALRAINPSYRAVITFDTDLTGELTD